jgi:hypothetical protein
MRQDASMVAKIVQAPGRGPASRFAELKGYVERNLMIVFVTAPALRLKDVNQTGSKVFVNRFLRNVAIAFSPHSSLAQLRRQRASAGDKFVGSRNIARLSAQPQVGDAHDVSSSWAKDAPAANPDQASDILSKSCRHIFMCSSLVGNDVQFGTLPIFVGLGIVGETKAP